MMITRTTSINELLRSYPMVREVFARHGMGCIGCMGAATETIENGAKMHDIDVEALLKELNELCMKK
jgi:hybrid cluster-associated redox disulfide protein